MRAVVNTHAGGPEVLEQHERPMPSPGVGQIRVRVRASALNRADILQRLGGYPAPAGASTDIPGLEYAGEVDSLGEEATLWSPGARVMGLVGGGGHAEYVCVHEREAMVVPDNLCWEEAAAIPEAFLTAYDAIVRQLRITVGERVLVHAVGSGVGTAVIQLARISGAHVFGTSRSILKLERAKELGLDIGIDTSSEHWPTVVAEATGQKGVDAIVDLLGGRYFADGIRSLSPNGRLILIGLTAGRSAELDLGIVLNKRAHIVGTVLRSRPLEEKISLAREFSSHMTPLFEVGRVRPVIDRVFSFAEVREAHQLMESNSNFGKIVLRWE